MKCAASITGIKSFSYETIKRRQRECYLNETRQVTKLVGSSQLTLPFPVASISWGGSNRRLLQNKQNSKSSQIQTG